MYTLPIKLNNNTEVRTEVLHAKGNYFIHHTLVKVDGLSVASNEEYIKFINKEETISCRKHNFTNKPISMYSISMCDSTFKVVELSNLKLAKKLVRMLVEADRVRFMFNLDLKDKEVLEALRQEILRFFRNNNYTNFKLKGGK